MPLIKVLSLLPSINMTSSTYLLFASISFVFLLVQRIYARQFTSFLILRINAKGLPNADPTEITISLILFKIFWIQFFDNLCRHSTYNSIIRDIFGDDSSGSYDAKISDCYSG